MGKFLQAEKAKQAVFKADSGFVSAAARAQGEYKKRFYNFCLPRSCADENLFDGIRAAAINYFAKNKISWHDGHSKSPSNHLCDSQVCCVNFLYPFANKPDALAELLRPVFGDIRQMLPMEGRHYVAFEWIGEQDYLGESRGRKGKRTRGANFTSADAAVKFMRKDGKTQIVLIEWKYTESYPASSIKISKNRTDRSKRYAPLFEHKDCPVNKKLLPGYDALFYEPFYQFFRQQLLATGMENAKNPEAYIVSVLHIPPAHNCDFRLVTSPALRRLKDSSFDSATGVWKKLLRDPDRFVSVHTEQLFGCFPAGRHPALKKWWQYINERYQTIV